jgi:hypothetical protein
MLVGKKNSCWFRFWISIEIKKFLLVSILDFDRNKKIPVGFHVGFHVGSKKKSRRLYVGFVRTEKKFK